MQKLCRPSKAMNQWNVRDRACVKRAWNQEQRVRCLDRKYHRWKQTGTVMQGWITCLRQMNSIDKRRVFTGTRWLPKFMGITRIFAIHFSTWLAQLHSSPEFYRHTGTHWLMRISWISGTIFLAWCEKETPIQKGHDKAWYYGASMIHFNSVRYNKNIRTRQLMNYRVVAHDKQHGKCNPGSRHQEKRSF